MTNTNHDTARVASPKIPTPTLTKEVRRPWRDVGVTPEMVKALCEKVGAACHLTDLQANRVLEYVPEDRKKSYRPVSAAIGSNHFYSFDQTDVLRSISRRKTRGKAFCKVELKESNPREKAFLPFEWQTQKGSYFTEDALAVRKTLLERSEVPLVIPADATRIRTLVFNGIRVHRVPPNWREIRAACEVAGVPWTPSLGIGGLAFSIAKDAIRAKRKRAAPRAF